MLKRKKATQTRLLFKAGGSGTDRGYSEDNEHNASVRQLVVMLKVERALEVGMRKGSLRTIKEIQELKSEIKERKFKVHFH